MVLLPTFLLASYSSAQITSVNKVPENVKNAVLKANSVVNAIRINPEIPFEEHAFLITTDTAYVLGVPPGKIVVLPPGNQVVQLKSLPYYGKVFLDFAFEPGKYYYIEVTEITPKKKKTNKEFKPEIVVLADGEKLEIAKQEAAKIKENLATCFEYLEYHKQHPNVLDGTYKFGLGKMVIKDNRLSWVKDIKEMGIKYDGETLILLGDRERTGDGIVSNIWYYRLRDDGKLEVMIQTDPILNGEGLVTNFVYKPVLPK